MKLSNGTLSLLIILALSARAVQSEDAPDKATAPKAVTPEVQTAAWAVKWWQPRHDQKLADLKKMEKVDLLMIGDSITHGWEGRGKKV